MMTKRKMILWMIVFLMAITGIRLTWISIHKTVEHPQAVKGVLDLRGWKFPADRTIRLDGEWELLPYRLVASDASSAPDREVRAERLFIQTPGSWNKAMPDSSYRYGTYRLRILVDRNDKPYALRIQEIRSAYAVYVNGALLAESGRPAEDRDRYDPRPLRSATAPRNRAAAEWRQRV